MWHIIVERIIMDPCLSDVIVNISRNHNRNISHYSITGNDNNIKHISISIII